MISQAARYALRALAYLDALDDTSYVPVRRLGDGLGISVPFLAKILNQLVTAGLLEAMRGPTGGVRLARPADRISVREVVETVDGHDVFTECVLGLPGCGDREPCPMHEAWAQIRDRIAESFASQTIADLSHGFGSGNQRLSA